jgi:hypothetical protein
MISTASAALGFVLKGLWDTYTTGKRERWKLRVEKLEQALSEFYWPICIRLIRDDLIWKIVFNDIRLNKGEWLRWVINSRKHELSHKIINDIIIPNQKEILEIIRLKIHMAGSREITSGLEKYVRHADIFISLRSADIENITPADMSSVENNYDYPSQLCGDIKNKIDELQDEYDKLVSQKTIGAL